MYVVWIEEIDNPREMKYSDKAQYANWDYGMYRNGFRFRIQFVCGAVSYQTLHSSY